MAEHSHNHEELSRGRFFSVTLLNVLITVAEFIGGVFSGSLSLISDAFHNLGDSLSIVISYVASRISLKNQDENNTYGYKRAQIITAFLNSIALVIICLVLIVEAVRRFSHPEPIDGPVMLTVAIIGLVANAASALMLNAGAKNNLNMRATYLHIMSDALSSVAIIIGGVLIELFHWNWVDPLVTILVAGYIAYETWPIIRQTNRILMEGAPKIDYEGIKTDLLEIDGVYNVHHVHAWLIDEHNIVFSAHVNLHDMKISEAQPIYREIDHVLKTKYGVCHTTIQAEADRGKNEDIIYDQGEDI